MEAKIFTTIKKTFYYNFLPTKAQEEYYEANRITKRKRTLIEIRDVYKPPELYEKITKLLNQSEISSGKFRIPSSVLFEHVLRYWTMKDANDLVSGLSIKVTLLDVTTAGHPIKYETKESNRIEMCVTTDGDCELSCSELMKVRELKDGDEIMYYWDTLEKRFAIKTFRKAGEAICVYESE